MKAPWLWASILAPLLGCNSAPTNFAECANVKDDDARIECQYKFARQLVDQEEALHAALASLNDPAAHDLLLLRLVVDAPESARFLCARAASNETSFRCRHILGRPHLIAPPKDAEVAEKKETTP